MYQGQKYIERICSAHLHCHHIFRRKNPLFCGEINRLGLLFCWSGKAIELHGTEGGEVDLCLTGMKLLLLEEGIGKGIELESWGKREWNRALCKLPKVSNKLGGLELQRGFPSALVGKNLLPVQEMKKRWVRSLGGEDPLEEGMATPSSILIWRILWTGEPGGLQSRGSCRVGQDWSSLACTHARLHRDEYPLNI